MIALIYELVTGKPWITVRSMAAEFGPPPAVRYAGKLAALTDDELLVYGDQIVARARDREAIAWMEAR